MSNVKWESQSLDDWARQHAKGKFISLDGHQTHYIEQGEEHADKAPIILVHGFFYDSFMWQSNMDAFSEHHKVYAPDLWGFGYSTREPMDYGYALYVRQVIAFMDALGIQKATIVGQSFGGGTAIKMAVDYPDRVNKLILISASGMPNSQPLMAKIINTFPALGRFMYGLDTDSIRKKGLLDYFVYDKALLSKEYFDNVTRFHKIKGTVAVMLDIMRRDFFFTLQDEIHQLAELQKDILIVWGEYDKGNPLRLGQAMHEILRGSKLEVIKNAKHVANSERPQIFNSVATAFLAS